MPYITFLAHIYSIMLMWPSQSIFGLSIVRKKKNQNSKVDWDCYIKIVVWQSHYTIIFIS